MNLGRPRSVGRPRKQSQPQEEPQLDDLNNDEVRALDEVPYGKIKQGALWSGLVDLDHMKGKVIAPLTITEDLELVDSMI